MYGIGIFDNDESNWTFKDAIQYCIDNVIQLVNISMSIIDTKTNRDIIKKAYQAGIIMITSAGNGRGKAITFPGDMDEVLAIGALDNNFKYHADYASHGESIEVCFPGNFFIPNLKDPNKYSDFDSGTSYSTPCATGFVSLFMKAFKKINNRYPTLNEIRKYFIYKYAIDIENPGVDETSGHGKFVLPNSDIWVNDIPVLEEDMEIKMYIGNKIFYVNGEEKEMDVAPFTQNDRTFLPVRFLAEALGCIVEWNEELQEVKIIK